MTLLEKSLLEAEAWNLGERQDDCDEETCEACQ
jgi:hypothetical protein